MDFAFALKNRDNIPVYKYNRPRDYEVLKRDVLNSDRVKYTVEKVSAPLKISLSSFIIIMIMIMIIITITITITITIIITILIIITIIYLTY